LRKRLQTHPIDAWQSWGEYPIPLLYASQLYPLNIYPSGPIPRAEASLIRKAVAPYHPWVQDESINFYTMAFPVFLCCFVGTT
jgi:hypothetical protein